MSRPERDRRDAGRVPVSPPYRFFLPSFIFKENDGGIRKLRISTVVSTFIILVLCNLGLRLLIDYWGGDIPALSAKDYVGAVLMSAAILGIFAWQEAKRS